MTDRVQAYHFLTRKGDGPLQPVTFYAHSYAEAVKNARTWARRRQRQIFRKRRSS